jgi:hypothetical protein
MIAAEEEAVIDVKWPLYCVDWWILIWTISGTTIIGRCESGALK